MSAPLVLTQAYRPFFPLAALFSALGIILWLAGLSGMVSLPPQPTLWHAHEMLFGFAAAIIAGFVLTAVVNWTGQPSTTPVSLGLLVGFWISARVLGLFSLAGTQYLASIVDSLFLPIVAMLMTRVLIKSRNQRNYMFIPFLWGIAGINISFHISLQTGEIELARLLITLTAWLVGFLMVFMGGRVIPFFSGRRCHYTPTQWPWLNWTSTVSALLTALLLVLLPQSLWTAGIAAIAGITTLLRLLLWQKWHIWREPMLWILHIGYAWLGLAFLLAAMTHMGWLMEGTLPIHALMAGGLGCLGLGMMTRVALGHSGQPIEASPMMLAAFVLVIVAGILRVTAYLPLPSGMTALSLLTYSAMLWCLAFSIYFVCFSKRLWKVQHTSTQHF